MLRPIRSTVGARLMALAAATLLLTSLAGCQLLPGGKKSGDQPGAGSTFEQAEPGSTAHQIALGDERLPLAGVNQTPGANDLVLFTYDKHPTVPGDQNAVDLIVLNGVVKHTRRVAKSPEKNPTAVPASGYVLSGRGSMAERLASIEPGVPVAVLTEDDQQIAAFDAVADPSHLQLGCRKFAVAPNNAALPTDDVSVYRGGNAPELPAGTRAATLVTDGRVAQHFRQDFPKVADLKADQYLITASGKALESLSAMQPGAPVIPFDISEVPTWWPRSKPDPIATNNHLPSHILAYYWLPYAHKNLTEVPAGTSVMYASFAHGHAHQGRPHDIIFEHGQTDDAIKAQMAQSKAQGVTWVLSFGGGGNLAKASVLRDENDVTATFNALVPIIEKFEFKGLDYDLEGGPETYTGGAILSLSKKLKAKFGDDFIISFVPRPFEKDMFAIAGEHEKAGILDLLQIQFYDAPEIADRNALRDWSSSTMDCARSFGIPYEKMVMGAKTGRSDAATGVSNVNDFIMIMDEMHQQRRVRGSFLWHIGTDATTGWPFRTGVDLMKPAPKK